MMKLLILIILAICIVALIIKSRNKIHCGGAVKKIQKLFLPDQSVLMVKQKIKTIDGWIYDPMIKTGPAQLYSVPAGESIKIKITDIRPYKTLEDFIFRESVHELTPHLCTMRDCITFYNGRLTQNARNAASKKYGYEIMGIEFIIGTQ